MKKILDLTGQKFNEITVLEKDIALSQEKKHIYWKCQCSCGRIKSIRSDSLKKIQTCGECTKNLIGQKFGRLIVLEKGKKDKFSHQFYICKCECGNICEINSDNLRRGYTKSCGCLHNEIIHTAIFKDITGEKFGKLTALEYQIKNSKSYWLCQCDCGNQIIVAGSNLKNNHTQSCGCINYSIGEKNIINLLNKNNINYIKEYVFKDFPNRRYDFYLPELNRIIEFDGIQHIKFINTWHKTKENFILAQQRDIEKNNYALNHHIDLIRIPHFERDNITLEMIIGNKYLITNEFEEENLEINN